MDILREEKTSYLRKCTDVLSKNKSDSLLKNIKFTVQITYKFFFKGKK